MLLRSFNRATQSPKEFIEDILNDTLDPLERLAATEMLGFVEDTTLAFPVIEKQLSKRDVLLNEAAIQALRTLLVRESGTVFPGSIRKQLVRIAVSSNSPELRTNAAEALADFSFNLQDTE